MARTVQFDDEDVQDQESDEEGSDEGYEEKVEFRDIRTMAELRDDVEELALQVGRMSTPRPVERNLAAELGDDADDDDQGVAQGERPPLIAKATRNADTPSANKILARLGEDMKAQSEWMMMFGPVPMAQAKWPVLGPELMQPVRGGSIENIVEDTQQLLRAMGYRCSGRPTPLILKDWRLTRAVKELVDWKHKLRQAFGLQMVSASQTTNASQAADFARFDFDTGKVVSQRPTEFGRLGEDPSKAPLPKTPDTTKRGVFQTTEGTPYFQDSHMQTPKKDKLQSGRYAELYDSADDAERFDNDTNNDGNGDRGDPDESVRDYIRHLSFDEPSEGRTSVLEVRSHASLDKIAEFEDKRYRPDDSLQRLKRFIYEMKGTRMPQNSWCEPFSLSLGRAAKGWYRQLPRKTQQRWDLLSEAFLDYYCSQFDQSARTRYYSARRKEGEPICDFLIRLNGYARTAKIQYEAGGADAADHVEQFLLNCGDDDVMDLLYPMHLDDFKRVEKIINRKILGEKRKKQRDRLTSNSSRYNRDGRDSRCDNHREPPRRNDTRRGEQRSERCGRDDRRARRDNSRDRRVAVAGYDSAGEREDSDRGQSSRQLGYYDSEDDQDDYSGHDDCNSDDEDDYVDTGFASDRSRGSGGQGNSARGPPNPVRDRNDAVWGRPNSASQYSRQRDHRNQPGRREGSREHPPYGPCGACGGLGHSAHFCRRRCKFCKQVHDVGQCELFQRYEKLVAFVKSTVNKSKVPDDLQDLYTPSDLNTAARQH